MKYYHATAEDTAKKIVQCGEIRIGYDGIVYLADSIENALKFISLRALGKYNKLIIFEIEVPDESLIEETFDHSFQFFQCKSYGYPENISTSCILNAYEYDMRNLL